MHGLAVYVKEGLPFARDLSLENYADSYDTYVFDWLYFTHWLYLCMVFYSSSSNIDEVLSINLSANMLIFGDFNTYQKDSLTLHDVKNAEICALYWKKEGKVSLTDWKLKCFSS